MKTVLLIVIPETIVFEQFFVIREIVRHTVTLLGKTLYQQSPVNKILPEIDIVYMTRIQKERISVEDYEKAKGKYVINEKNLKLVRPEARIMHPLPHVEEINLSLGTEQHDKRIAYFRQAENGLWIRMALLLKLLGKI
jgi:aspartate carbamoyltransferase catalytic subunit